MHIVHTLQTSRPLLCSANKCTHTSWGLLEETTSCQLQIVAVQRKPCTVAPKCKQFNKKRKNTLNIWGSIFRFIFFRYFNEFLKGFVIMRNGIIVWTHKKFIWKSKHHHILRYMVLTRQQRNVDLKFIWTHDFGCNSSYCKMLLTVNPNL